MSFLNLEDKTFLITGVSNKKSIATFAANTLLENGAKIILSVQTQEQLEKCRKLYPEASIYICNVESQEDIDSLAKEISNNHEKIDGLLHSMAFANFSDGPKPFHETKLEDYLQASQISCFSLVQMTNALKEHMKENASIVTMSISNTRATSYGYLGPIKAMLDSSVAFLAKSLSSDTQIRVNAVGAGPLKTSASAGIPDYIENFIFAEQLTLRKEALRTQEVANTIAFLLSDRSSGINATTVLVDAGMSCNYFDQDVVKSTAKALL